MFTAMNSLLYEHAFQVSFKILGGTLSEMSIDPKSVSVLKISSSSIKF